MNVYVVSVARKDEPRTPVRAEPSLDAARWWISNQWHVELFRESHNAWKGTNGFDEYWCHKIELTMGAA